MPVGRGDPLKNDPTFDYSPPVLDRVQYWGNSNKSKEKKDILLLGVTSKRSHKKEPKHNTIMRRNFFSHLPTRLMPPPMQTISPSMKHSSTENYHGAYYHNRYNMPSQSWSHNSINYGDSNVEESINYVSVSRPNKNSIRNEYTQHNTQPPRKPWLHALLEKEVTKPTASNYVMQPSKSVYESHPPPSLEPLNPVPSSTVRTTTSTTSTTSEAPYFQPTVLPEIISPTTDPLFAHYDQPQGSVARPMYLIIEGHSKVKTYGQNDNSTVRKHIPKIVPIKAAEESIIKHVVSEDDTGHAMEVMHLHTTQPPTPSTTPSPSAMGDLLSLLDSSLGNFFLGEDSTTKKSKTKGGSDKPKSEKTEKPEKPEDPKASEKKDASEKSEDPKAFVKKDASEKSDNSDNAERESRQIFDYDNLPEPMLREEDGMLAHDFQITLQPKNAQGVTFDTDFDYPSTEIV